MIAYPEATFLGKVTLGIQRNCLTRLDRATHRPKLVHMSHGFSDFLMVSSIFNSNNSSCSLLSKNWGLFTQLAASRIQIVTKWLPVAFKLFVFLNIFLGGTLFTFIFFYTIHYRT
jgi:hypothetical protein